MKMDLLKKIESTNWKVDRIQKVLIKASEEVSSSIDSVENKIHVQEI